MGATRYGKFSIPPGFDSINDLGEALYRHQSDQINVTRFSDSDYRPVVGIIDSVYEPGDDFRDRSSVVSTRDLLTGVDTDMTTRHGLSVSQLIRSYASSVSFRFYRVTQETTNGNPVIFQRHLQQAMGYAHLKDGVDILNISLGNDHSGDNGAPCDMPTEPCKIRSAARDAIDDGICIVAGAGNRDRADSICCPALSDDVIAVGGSVSKCTARLSPDNAMSLGGRDINPPLACWLEEDGESTEILCSGRGCSIGMSCNEYRRTIEWEGNVPPTNAKPDVYAPAVASFTSDDGQGYFGWGTSYAAPIVTGAVCEIVAGLNDTGIPYTPTVLKRAISENGTELDDGTEPLLDAAQLTEAISNHYDLDFNIDRSPPDSYSTSPFFR